MRVQATEVQFRPGQDALHRRDGRPAGQGQPELLVLMGGGDVLVRVGFHPHGHPQQDRRPDPVPRGGVGEPVDLRHRVDDDPPDPGLHRPVQLGVGLVVAMQADGVRGHAGPEQHSQLAAGTGVHAQPVLHQPARHLGAQERLAGVVDVGPAAQLRERVPEGVPEGHRPAPEVGLVEHVRWRAVLGREVPDVDPAHLQRARIVAPHRARPQLRQQLIDVGRRAEPGRDRCDAAVTGRVKGASLVSSHGFFRSAQTAGPQYRRGHRRRESPGSARVRPGPATH